MAYRATKFLVQGTLDQFAQKARVDRRLQTVTNLCIGIVKLLRRSDTKPIIKGLVRDVVPLEQSSIVFEYVNLCDKTSVGEQQEIHRCSPRKTDVVIEGFDRIPSSYTSSP